MADWEVALEKQIATWLFLNTEEGVSFVEGFRQSEIESDPANANVNKHLFTNLTSTLWAADPVYVTREMMDLLEAAMPKFEPEVFHAEDVFIPTGFVYLPRPVLIKDVRGFAVAHRAIAWQQAVREEDGKPATYVSTWADLSVDTDDYIDHETPEIQRKLRQHFGQSMVLNYASPMIYGMTPGEMVSRIAHNDQGTMPLDPKKRDIPWMPARDEGLIEDATLDILRFLQCLWRLLGQQIAIGMQQRPARATRRRAEKARFPDKYVTVVTLRRPRRPAGDSEHHPVDWAQRWIVSGHWRWQPYKDGSVKQIWISPYIKGPEDRPLVIRGARVFRWAR